MAILQKEVTHEMSLTSLLSRPPTQRRIQLTYLPLSNYHQSWRDAQQRRQKLVMRTLIYPTSVLGNPELMNQQLSKGRIEAGVDSDDDNLEKGLL